MRKENENVVRWHDVSCHLVQHLGRRCVLLLKTVRRETMKAKICPYAIRLWSGNRQWEPGCREATTEYCSADPDCALRNQEQRRREYELLGKMIEREG